MAVRRGSMEGDPRAADPQAMTNLLLETIAIVFLLKIVWNLSIPYVLWVRSARSKNSDRGSISLMPSVEIVLLIAMVALSLRAHDLPWHWSTGCIALCGGILMVGSYLHLVVAGAIAGRFVRRIHEPRSPGRPGPSA
jgi:hypothetical protein